MSMEFNVTAKGPIFNGQEAAVLARFQRALEEAVGGQILANWQLFMDRAFKNPTPYYETQVMLDLANDSVIVTDRAVIYGPWLEGTSPRNASSSFKGYQSLRRAIQQTYREVPRIAMATLKQHIGEL